MSFLHFTLGHIKATRKSKKHMLIIHTQLSLCQESLDPNRALNIQTLTEELIVVKKIICCTDNQRPSRTWGDESSDSQRKHLGTLPSPSCWSWSPLWERWIYKARCSRKSSLIGQNYGVFLKSLTTKFSFATFHVVHFYPIGPLIITFASVTYCTHVDSLILHNTSDFRRNLMFF